MSRRNQQAKQQNDGTQMEKNTPISTSSTKDDKPKGKSKPKIHEFKGKDGYPKQKGSNDPAWHSPDAKILERVCNLSWAYQTGEVIETSHEIGVGTSRAIQPGIMVIREKIAAGSLQYQSHTGRVVDYASPATVAANTLLTEMRSRARLRNTYDAPDVMMLMAAMANLYGGIFFAKRLAATAKAFAYQNEYLPRQLFHVQGMSYDWFREHLFDFVSELNVIISEVNKVYIPANMSLIRLINERWSNYYSEGEDIRDQIYLFTPGFLCAIDYSVTTDYASSLVPVMTFPGKVMDATDLTKTKYDSSNLYTGDELLSALKFMLRRIVNSSDTADITGDMMNCFGESNRFMMPGCDPSVIAVPVMNEEILEAIHNIKICYGVNENFVNYDGSTVSRLFRTLQLPTSNDIGDFNIFDVSAAGLAVAGYESDFKLLDVHKDPNPYKTMEITRLRNDVIAYGTESGQAYVALDMGAELILSIEFVSINASNGARDTKLCYNWIDAAATTWYDRICIMAPFHYSQLVLPIDISTGVGINNKWYIGETDIFTELPKNYQKEMNRISLLTLYGAYGMIK